MTTGVPTLVTMPAWGHPDAPWSDIVAGWPGETVVYWGAGLSGRPFPPTWSTADDAAELAELMDDATILCAAGWAASIGLDAAARVRPRAVLLWEPPFVDLADLVRDLGGSGDAALSFMRELSGLGDEWDEIEAAPGAAVRALAYLTQNAAASLEPVEADVYSLGPAGWPLAPAGHHRVRAIECATPGDAPALLLAALESGPR